MGSYVSLRGIENCVCVCVCVCMCVRACVQGFVWARELAGVVRKEPYF